MPKIYRRGTGAMRIRATPSKIAFTVRRRDMERIEKSIEVHVPIKAAYNQWTQFEEFPKFMEGIRQVRQQDDRHVHWVAEIGGKHKEWDAEITEQVPDRRIAWRSMGGARNDGVVQFNPVAEGDTRITLHMDYDPEGVI